METAEFNDIKMSLRMLRDIVARRAVHMRIVTHCRPRGRDEDNIYVYDIEISDLPPPSSKKDTWKDAISFNFDSTEIEQIHKVLVFTALVFTYDGLDVYIDGNLFDPDKITRNVMAENENA